MQKYSSKHLHIIVHDVPWPADFGGVVDIFYKIKWLYTLGIKIHLHCFIKDRPPQEALTKYCETVHYYKRKGVGAFSFSLPYIVSSRVSSDLQKNLEKDDFPILFEGIHTSYPLHENAFAHRKLFIRLFNTEYHYYGNLAKHEKNFLKKIYFRNEARLLERYERDIATKASIWTLSSFDKEVYSRELGADDVHFLPVFLPWDKPEIKEGNGDYCLYHGNLSVNENELAALWLIQNIFSKSAVPLIVAGKNPSQKLKTAIQKYNHVSIVENPDEQKMQDLIVNAQVNILPSFNNTGVKLKLLNALFNGRHCLVNKAGCAGSKLDDLCHIAETPAEFKLQLAQLFHKPFSTKEILRREEILCGLYNNEKNVKRISAWIW